MLVLLAGCLLPAGAAFAQTTVKYIHTDALGSVVAVTDQNRNVLERREYEPYGQQLIPALADGPGYTGHVQDAATGLTYMQQRYYDPQLGVFLSVDPVAAYQSPTSQFHRYRYANNNPYRFTDPDGRAVETPWDMFSFGVGVHSLSGNLREGNWGAAGLDAVGVIADGAAVLLPGLPGGASVGIKAARGADAAIGAVNRTGAAADGAKGADFVVTPGGTAVPTSQSRMTDGFEAAGMQGTPLPDGKGTSYTMPDGMNVRAMEPSGQAPRRASFTNSNGGPVTPDGKVPQPPRGASAAERRDYVRDRTHVEQNK
ncbi:RHS repeat-associated core domain-containing protein [Luteimonas sp. RD2P54]|uniref:RHS repeat-associated core domain-containing protein n=2 Tax=Luteimonas endophytica TaxID=3042023 RepID=A0ABT6J6N2_9GAMM|nr:RHS repeat-associated core domain-containing protein [Luteimonas endophytica]MDH5822492.1 RHS repeat-associated core domain-containing protein [Luteimonas endophytica]